MQKELTIPLDDINSLNITTKIRENPTDKKQTEPDNETVDMAPIAPEDDLPISEPPENRSELSISYEGTEKVIFKQDVPQTNEVVAARTFINFSSVVLTIFMLGYLLMGFFIEQVFLLKIPDFTHVLFTLCVVFILKATAELSVAIIDAASSTAYLRNAADSLTSLVVIQAFLFYLDGFYTERMFIGFLFANVIMQFMKIMLFGFKKAPLGNLVLLIESFSILFIGLKLANPEHYGPWAFILIWYTCLYYLFIPLIVAATMVVFFLLILYFFHQNNENHMTGLQLITIIAVYLIVSCGCSTVCLIYLSVRALLEAGAIRPQPSAVPSMPIEMLIASRLMIGQATFCLLFVFIFNTCFRDFLFRSMTPQMGKEISLKTYASAFALKLKAISGKFFRKPQSKDHDVELSSQPTGIPLDECVVCQTTPSNFLLHPCNHCVLCQDCVRQFLEFQNKCPICKELIQKCSHIALDDKNNSYMIDYAYKLKSY